MSSSPTKALPPLRFGSREQTASWFRALGDETQLEIIDRLSADRAAMKLLTRRAGIVNLFALMQYQGKGEGGSPLYSLRQPGLES